MCWAERRPAGNEKCIRCAYRIAREAKVWFLQHRTGLAVGQDARAELGLGGYTSTISITTIESKKDIKVAPGTAQFRHDSVNERQQGRRQKAGRTERKLCALLLTQGEWRARRRRRRNLQQSLQVLVSVTPRKRASVQWRQRKPVRCRPSVANYYAMAGPRRERTCAPFKPFRGAPMDMALCLRVIMADCR